MTKIINRNFFPGFLKVSFKKFTATTDVELLHVVTIIARQLYHYNVRSTTTYKSWVETTIGSLYYLIKEPAQFTRAIEAVGGLICYENDREILETHLITPLSSVRGTNNLVLECEIGWELIACDLCKILNSL